MPWDEELLKINGYWKSNFNFQGQAPRWVIQVQVGIPNHPLTHTHTHKSQYTYRSNTKQVKDYIYVSISMCMSVEQ